MGTRRTQTRRQQRKANRQKRRDRAARWAALSPEEQARELRGRWYMDELNRLTMDVLQSGLMEAFTRDNLFYRMLKR